MRWYFSHRIVTDLILSIAVAALVAFQPSLGIVLFYWPHGEAFQALMLAISASSSTMVGFVLAASTFLISHTNHPRFKILRASKGFKQLVQIIKSTMWRLIGLAVAAGVGSLAASELEDVSANVIVFFATYALLGLCTLTWCTLTIIEIPAE